MTEEPTRHRVVIKVFQSLNWSVAGFEYESGRDGKVPSNRFHSESRCGVAIVDSVVHVAARRVHVG